MHGQCSYVMDVYFTAILLRCLEAPFPSPFPPLPQLVLALLQGQTAVLHIQMRLEFAMYLSVAKELAYPLGGYERV